MFYTLLILLFFTTIFVGQTVSPISVSNDKETLIERVLKKADANKARIFSDYQYSFSSIVEDEKTHRKKSWEYELYCGVDGRSNCQQVLVGINNKPFSSAKIKKAREKASKKLLSNNENTRVGETFSYGLPFGYAKDGQNYWVDPSFYLRDCRLNYSENQKINDREITIIRVGDCQIESEPWKKSVAFMVNTEAEIMIDNLDESVTRMIVYPLKELINVTEESFPIIKVDLTRVAEGFWLYKTVTLDATNKQVFPLGHYKFEYKFFDYKRLNVDVESNDIEEQH